MLYLERAFVFFAFNLVPFQGIEYVNHKLLA